ncbi:hypothetical protein [Pontibacter vulgaris]|uniref:hypothetical protein n=1 Tax=Pontibacter vulgaris TaxID=2905679 RepID=UPI001FA80D8E|nr:hypothetical protein [Pontibacter vulgaris]
MGNNFLPTLKKSVLERLDKNPTFYKYHRQYQISCDNLMFSFLSRKIKRKQKESLKVALFYPEGPRNRSMLRKLLAILGYEVTTNLSDAYSFAVFWIDDTFKEYVPKLEAVAAEQHVLNYHCTDISKERVNEVLEEVFGYSMAVDPLVYQGVCVKKGNKNAVHDGTTITCPIAKPEEGYVYHKLINNQANSKEVEDIRVPIIGNRIPFVYMKNRPLESRFASKNSRVVITPTEAVLSPTEVQNIISFCQKLGLEYGELDVLRDRTDGRIYIVDANNTPGGPPNQLNRKEQMRALLTLAQAFQDEFIEKSPAKARKDKTYA